MPPARVVKFPGPEADWPIWVRVSFGEPDYGGSEEDLTRRMAVLRTGAADLKAAASAAGPPELNWGSQLVFVSFVVSLCISFIW